jgi:hypothetical protein
MVLVEIIMQVEMVQITMGQGDKMAREMVLEKWFTVKWLKKVKGLK